MDLLVSSVYNSQRSDIQSNILFGLLERILPTKKETSYKKSHGTQEFVCRFATRCKQETVNISRAFVRNKRAALPGLPPYSLALDRILVFTDDQFDANDVRKRKFKKSFSYIYSRMKGD